MSRPGITYQDVAIAATQLLALNIRPTVEEIRKILKTGSHSTINRLLREWREQQGEGLVAAEGLPASLLSLVKNLYKTMENEAQLKLDAASKEHSDVLAGLQKQEQQLREQWDTLRANHEQLNASFIAADQLTKQQATALQAQEQTISQQNLSLTHLRDQLNDRIQYATQLEKECQLHQANLEHYRETMRAHREEERQHYEAQLAEAQQSIQELKINHRNLTGLLKESQQHQQMYLAEIKHLQEELSDLQLTHVSLEAKHSQMMTNQLNQIAQLEQQLLAEREDKARLKQELENKIKINREKQLAELAADLAVDFDQKLKQQFNQLHDMMVGRDREKKIKQECL